MQPSKIIQARHLPFDQRQETGRELSDPHQQSFIERLQTLRGVSRPGFFKTLHVYVGSLTPPLTF
jgi:hypothetical protein